MYTKISDFQIGDKFTFYGHSFTVTGDLQTFEEGNTTVYGRTCQIDAPAPKSNISDILNAYKWMQGTDAVTYYKKD